MRGQDFIESAISDFESFYVNGFKIQREYLLGIGLKISGSNEQQKLTIPIDFADMELETDELKFYALLLIGHELSHYINKHNYHIDNSDTETKALEMWADFFGSVIAMSIFILGEKTKSLFSFNPFINKEKGLKTIIDSYEYIYPVFKNTDNSDKYEHSSERLITLQSGIVSFLVRYEIAKKILDNDTNDLAGVYFKYSKAWALEFAKLTFTSPSLMEIVEIRDDLSKKDLKRLEERKNIVNKIHIKLMNNNLEITSGIHPQLRWILGTDYIRPDIEYKSRKHAEKLADNTYM